MKILSRMMSKKIDPEAPDEHSIDDENTEFAPFADDTGEENVARGQAARPTRVKAKDEEPDVATSGWEAGDWDDNWDDDDEEWGDDELDTDDIVEDKEHLVSEIREAIVSPVTDEPASDAPDDSVAGWSSDEPVGRRERARSQLALSAVETEERILEKTEDVMSDRATSRRRSAMAHMKAAAAATKADRVLQHVASRDPSTDPEEQSPYRDDLAKVVRPQSTSRPISRQVSRAETATPVWDQGAGDEDAALFAASEEGAHDDPVGVIEDELAAAEAERLARTPAALSEDDFADDFGSEDDDFTSARKPSVVQEEFPASPFADVEEGGEDDLTEDDFAPAFAEEVVSEETSLAEDGPIGEPSSAFDAPPEDPFDDPAEAFEPDSFDEEDDFAPRPSSVVSEAVAFANAPDDDDLFEPAEEEVRKKIWEVADEVASAVENVRATAPEQPPAAAAPEEPVEDFNAIASLVPGRAGAGRVKTRLLGFQTEDTQDIFAKSAENSSAQTAVLQPAFPVGWIVVVDGPGRGASFALMAGVSQIGRGDDQAVRLDFGDTSISRNNHAAVAYDDEQGKFFLGHGGKSNLVRKNGMPVLSTEELAFGDTIRIGETTLKFIALCGDDFKWSDTGDAPAHA